MLLMNQALSMYLFLPIFMKAKIMVQKNYVMCSGSHS